MQQRDISSPLAVVLGSVSEKVRLLWQSERSCFNTTDIPCFADISWMEMSKVNTDPITPSIFRKPRSTITRTSTQQMIPTLLNRFEIQLADPDAAWKETCW